MPSCGNPVRKHPAPEGALRPEEETFDALADQIVRKHPAS